MKLVRYLLVFLFLTFGVIALSNAQSGSDAVAVVNGQTLTTVQLERSQGSKLLQARYQYYQAERKALDDLVDEQLLSDEAARRKISVDELLKEEVLSHVKDPTEDQLQVYYEGLGTTEPYDKVRDKILESIRQIRTSKYRTAYVQSLRAKANIRIMLAPPDAEVSLKDSPILGAADAPVVLVEFADFECPYCQKVYADVKKLQATFPGQLAISFKDFPLPMHPHAQKAAEAARCAGNQFHYWEYHDLLFSTKQLDVSQLKEHAKALKLDQARFDQCLDSGAEAAAVERDKDQAQALGLTGTPSFFVNGHFFSGSVDYYTLKEMVDQELANRTMVSQNANQSSGSSTKK